VLKSIRVRRKVLATVRKMELLKALSLQQRQQVVDLMTQVSFPAGSYIARQGERCDNFYVIVDGECESSITTVTPTVDERHYTLLGGESDENKEAIGPPQEITGSRKIPKSASAAALAALAAAAAAGEEAQKMQMQLTQTEVARMKPNEFFCQHVLLSANSVSRRTVVAMTNMKLLYISRMTFEEYLGPLSTIIESHHKRIAAASRRTIEVPRSLAQIRLQGLITADSSGPLLLGTFGDAPLPNVMIRSFLMKEVDRLRMSNTVLTLIEGARAVAVAAQMVSHKPSSSSSAIAAYSTKTGSIHQSPHNVLVPELLSVCRDSSALHVIFNSPVVADLSSFLCANNSSGTLASHPDVIVYVAMCVISALEYLHELGILYRAIQPESLYVDSQGRIILSDYRVCKVGAVNGRTYTICGRADYLAPEMIIRQGHSGPVDFWALGLLLYELAVGKHPFAGANDLATYAKISSFGTAAFPTLPFSESVRPDMKFLIEKLLVPNPESRLGGGGSHSFAAMKSMLMFEGVDWAAMTTHPPTSPLLSLAIAECDSMTSEGVDPSLLAAFSEDYHGNGWELPALE
jgi:serine/threonine protein kinase